MGPSIYFQKGAQNTMKKILLLAIVMTVSAIAVHAQDVPKFEFAVKYNVLVADIDVLDNETTHGYGLSFQANINRYLGLVAEWGATHGASGPVTIQQPGALVVVPELDTRFQTFLGGPRVTWRKNRFNVFGHYLVGHGNSKVEDEQSGFRTGNGEFAMGVGGGLDIFIGKKVALRAAQFDYLPIHTDINARLSGRDGVGTANSSGSWQNNSRFQTGIVFRFGTK
jgi:opacity protein-like surface antigen